MRSFTRCLTSSVMAASRGRPDWEAGMNTRTPLTDATTPPLFSSVMMPSMISLLLQASSMFSQTLTASTFFLDRVA